MQKKRALMICVIAAVFACGFWCGRSGGVQAEASAATAAMWQQGENTGRVFEMRTYTANEGKAEALHARFRNHTTKLFAKHGMTNVGYWSPQEGPTKENTLIYILAHKDRETARKSWESFRNDPEWQKARDASEANGKIVGKLESVFLTPTDYSPMK